MGIQQDEEVKPFEFLLDPGTATKEDIAELLYEISKLYRMLGGKGLRFTITGVFTHAPYVE